MTRLSYCLSICLLTLLAGIFGASAQASEGSFFDYQTLRPSPQRVVYFNNGRTLTAAPDATYELRVTASLLEDANYIAARFKTMAGLTVEVTTDDALKSRGEFAAVLRTDKKWTGPEVTPTPAGKAAGYSMQIDPEGIFIAAEDRVGGFHGLQTMVQTIALALETRQSLPTVIITDWPDVANRSMLLVVNKLRGNDDLTYLKRVLDALAGLKFNSVFFEFDNVLPGPKYRFPTLVPNPLDEAKVRELCDYARSLHLEVNLAFQFGSHCTWLLYEPAYEKLGEAERSKMGWNNTNWSPLNEELWPVIEDLLKHQIEICKPKHVHIAHDELDFGEFNTSASSKAAGLSNEELTVKGINRLRQIIPSDINVLIWFDMYMPESMKRAHRVGFVNSDRVHQLTDKGIDMHVWLYGGDPHHVTAAEYLKRHGRKFWTSTFEPQGVERVCYFTKTLGAEGVMGTHWYEVDSKWNNPRNISPKAMQAIVALGQYAWSSSPVGNLLELDTVRLFRLLTDGADPVQAAGIAQQVDLSSVANGDSESVKTKAAWAAKLLSTVRSGRGDAVEQLQRTVPGGGVLLAGQKSEVGTLPQKVRIPVGQDVSAVTFFHTANIPDPTAGLDAWNNAFVHPRIGSYTLVFADGQKETIALDYRWNIQDWNSLYGAYASQHAWAATGKGGVRQQVQQVHWQAKSAATRKLDRIEFASDLRNGLNPFLLQVVAHVPAGSGQVASNDGEADQVIWADDFEYRSQNELQAAWSGIARKFGVPQMRVGGNPSGEKAIRWELKPANYRLRDDIGFQRERIDFTGANELSFMVRVQGGDEKEIRGFSCSLYLGNEKANYWYRYGFYLPEQGKWHRVRLPMATRFTEGKVPQEGGLANLDTFMISIWHQNQTPVTVLIDDVRVVNSQNPVLYRSVR